MNWQDFLQRLSLRTKVTFFTLGIFLLGFWTLALYSGRTLHEDMRKLVGDQQFSTVLLVSREIEHELDDRLGALEAVAARLGPLDLGDAAAVQARLDQFPLLQSLFNGGVIVLRRDGTMIAESPRSSGRNGVNYLDRDSSTAALKGGRSSVGQPFVDSRVSTPVFDISVPIRDATGRVIGAVSGVTILVEPHFLDRLVNNGYGKTGGYMVVARKSRLVVAASDRTLIMTALPASGVNPLLDRFVQGFEGTDVAINPFGNEVLASAKGLALADWYLAAALPTAEAFAPLHAQQRHLLLAAALFTLLAGVLIWWMLSRQLSPLLAAVKALATLPDEHRHALPLPVGRRDEVGQLIGGFNRLLESLAQRKAALRESEARYRSFFENSQDAIFVHRDDKIIFANNRLAELFRAESPATMLGRDWHELIVPQDWPITERRIASLKRGEASSVPPLERRHVTLDGNIVAIETTGTRIIFDGQPAVLSVFRDISERERAEERRLADVRQQRDTLVREVHHRIKNNLQSVAGLLRRELGHFAALNPRLETAITQVNAIAEVHGLQGADSHEAIVLCESLKDICASVAEITKRPVLFHAGDEATGFPPTRIVSREAVSLALVLNELVLNAVKHSPQGGPAPTVRLSTDGVSARIVIRNAVVSPPTFDIASGAGLDTGLRLVRSLLPEQGANLSFEPATAGFLDTILELAAPTLVSRPEEIAAETPPPRRGPRAANPAKKDATKDMT